MTTYEIVKVRAEADPFDEPDETSPIAYGGRPLVPGVYVSAVTELPAWQADDRHRRAHGFYAVFWPLDASSPESLEPPLYFGPFASACGAGRCSRVVATGLGA